VTLDRQTVAVYEDRADVYAARGTAPDAVRAGALVARAGPGPVIDLGCGTGSHLDLLGVDAVGVDPASAMMAHARSAQPEVPLVRAAAGALPFRTGSVAGVWAHKCLQHLTAAHLPLALADLHRVLPVGAPIAVTMFTGEGVWISNDDDDLPGRRFTLWSAGRLTELVEGAGFGDVDARVRSVPDAMGWGRLQLEAARKRTLADTVGPGMRLLVCGLNPSLHAADAGVGYAGPGNRFWPALKASGLVAADIDRDPWRLLSEERIGMTDLVKRASTRAAEVTSAEYQHGLERLDRLCALLAPKAVIMVGLAGWRAAVDRGAVPGWHRRRLGPSPVYVMPSTSGLNAAVRLDTLVEHLRMAAAPTSVAPAR